MLMPNFKRNSPGKTDTMNYVQYRCKGVEHDTIVVIPRKEPLCHAPPPLASHQA